MKRRKLHERLLRAEIKADRQFLASQLKHEREMRRSTEKFVAKESAAYRATQAREIAEAAKRDEEHFERLNNADLTAEKIALETKSEARDLRALTVARAEYESDRDADAKLRAAEREIQIQRDITAAAKAAQNAGESSGRKEVFGLSADALRLVGTTVAIMVGIILILRAFGIIN